MPSPSPFLPPPPQTDSSPDVTASISVALAPLTWPHLTRVHQLELLEFGVVLQAELLQLDGVRGLKTLPVLLHGGRQAVPLRRFLRHVKRA